jgi:hypothetical protein
MACLVNTMPQFDVYQNPNIGQRSSYPYVIDIQNDLFVGYSSRLVMPLQRLQTKQSQLPRRLTTPILINGERLYLAPHTCAAIPFKALGSVVLSLGSQRTIVKDALDAIVEGV